MKSLAVSLAVAWLALTSIDRAADQPTAPALNETESWVLARLQEGVVANLDQQFPADEAKRTLRAGFLEDLLTGTLPVAKARRWGINITGATFEEFVDLGNETIVCDLQLVHCHFKRPANFLRTNFTGAVTFSQSEFSSDVNFYGAKIAGNAFFVKTVFIGAAEFGSADFTGYFSLAQAQFRNADKGAGFAGTKVGANLSLDNAVFAGQVNFGNAVIAGNLTANDARFESKDKPVNFLSMKVRANALFMRAVFAGATDFGLSDIAGMCVLNDAQFQNSEAAASFINFKVGVNLSLNGTTFAGPVEFISTVVGAFLLANDTRFLSRKYPASFAGAKVGESAFFDGASFAGAVGLDDANFRDLEIEQPALPAQAIPELNLARCTITRRLTLQRLHVLNLVATSLRVDGPALFQDLQVDQKTDLGECSFAKLDLTGSRWPQTGGNFSLSGTHYQSIRAATKETESHDKLLALVDQAVYTADVYGNLEAFFARQGYADDANRVYIADRCRERRDTMNWHSFGFYWSWLLQGIGYGRYPERALYACALVVAFGCWVFKGSKMEPSESGAFPTSRQYSRFWYSLELFLPIVELKAVDAWEPKREYAFLRNYMRVHVLLGWILIPIALAAQAGLIK